MQHRAMDYPLFLIAAKFSNEKDEANFDPLHIDIEVLSGKFDSWPYQPIANFSINLLWLLSLPQTNALCF